VISTVAGGVGGPGRATLVAVTPCGVSFGAGHVYVSSFASVRKVDPGTDRLTTPAGTGVTGPLGDGRLATRASVSTSSHGLGTCGAAVDHSGNLVLADAGHSRIRVVAASTGTFYSQPMTVGNIYTVAGHVFGFAGDGGPATSAKLNGPAGVAVDAAGNLVIADCGNARVRVVAASTGTFYGQPMTAGNIYTIAGGGTGGLGDRGPATSAVLSSPLAMAPDAAGNVLIADSGHRRVRVVAAGTGTFYGKPMTAGNIYTIAGTGKIGTSGDGGPATGATLTDPEGVAADANGNVLIADTTKVRLVAAGTGTFYGKAMTAGDIYTVAGNGMIAFSGDGGPAIRAELNGATGVAADAAGNQAIADPGNNRVRVVAASTGTRYGKPLTAGDIYTIAGSRFAGFSGDGGPGTSAKLKAPDGVAADPAGNMLIADTQNARVRVVAASTGNFYGQPMTAGDIYTIAGTGTFGFAGDGGPATSAELSNPAGTAVDATGNVVIADAANNRVRVVAASTGTFYGKTMTAGDIYTIAGKAVAGFSGDGGPATGAELNNPLGVAVAAAGGVLIADFYSKRIREVAG
jgi:sugar lactone lactonase YvrE